MNNNKKIHKKTKSFEHPGNKFKLLLKGKCKDLNKIENRSKTSKRNNKQVFFFKISIKQSRQISKKAKKVVISILGLGYLD